MPYLTCGHCKRPLDKPSKRRYCSVLCRSAVAKQAAKVRLAEDRYHEATMRLPVFDLTDIECFEIEAKLSADEQYVFDSRGYGIKRGHQETASANANDLHESWANKGADLDVWPLRVADRLRYGGIVLSREWWQLHDQVKVRLAAEQGELTGFLSKVFPFELDEAYDSHLRNSDYRYDKDLRNAV